jgi:hypothetical protein
MFFDAAVAVAGSLLDQIAALDLDASAPIADQALFLEGSCGTANRVRCTPSISARYSWGQWNLVAVGAVMGGEKPAAEPSLQRMGRIARDRLHHLGKQRIRISGEDFADPGGACLGSFNRLDVETDGSARDLDLGTREGRRVAAADDPPAAPSFPFVATSTERPSARSSMSEIIVPGVGK